MNKLLLFAIVKMLTARPTFFLNSGRYCFEPWRHHEWLSDLMTATELKILRKRKINAAET